MVRRELPSHQRMVSRTWQLHEAIGGNLLVNPFRARLKSPELRLNRNLLDGNGADMHERRCSGNRDSRISPQFRTFSEPPQKSARI